MYTRAKLGRDQRDFRQRDCTEIGVRYVSLCLKPHCFRSFAKRPFAKRPFGPLGAKRLVVLT